MLVYTLYLQPFWQLQRQIPKNAIVQFVNRKFCNDALKKKKQLMSINRTELGFRTHVALYISENLTPFNQRLAFAGCFENQLHYE